MRKTIGLAVAVALAVLTPTSAYAGNGTAAADGFGKVATLAVYGDSPYGISPTDTAQFDATPAFIDSINADPAVSRAVHVGDIHSGKQFCTESYDRSIAALWTRFADPLVYTPGDNEWADCHKAAEGGGLGVDYADGNPAANLALVRSVFFPRPGGTLGAKDHVTSQAREFDCAHPGDAAYVENVRWRQAKVVFVTLNIPGGSNNDQDPWFGQPLTTQQSDEVANRTGADLRWLAAAFAEARGEDAKAVVIIDQADMWDLDGKTPDHLAGYDPFVAAVAAATQDFGRPVLMFNGDSHVYRSDNPLAASDPLNSLHAPPGGTYDVANFHRVVVHGSTTPLEWLRLTVDPKASNPASSEAFGPFSWARVQP
ncbi:MAG: hypothetical protein DLM59_19130 [Pseudonocardiales bacterium]|nr:MAG: hypothetical protein DLM59_19130 [Pseudonocardiales bacterium]